MSVESRIKNLNSLETLQSLLVEEIGFESENRAVFFDEESGLQSVYNRPAVIAELHGFSVLVLPTDADGLLKTRQRQAVEALRTRYPFALFIFVDSSLDNWHWVFSKSQGAGKRALRRMEIGGSHRLHTVAERLELLRKKIPDCGNQGEVAALVEEAFDVEAVGKTFFAEYQAQYRAFKSRILSDNPGLSWVREEGKLSRYVQLLLGRIMFLHFVEKKGWLDNNPDFIRTLFAPFGKKEKSGFHRLALSPLFFEALNKSGDRKHIDGIGYAIRFLNGGLFEARPEFNEDDPVSGPLVADELFSALFAMLGRYNFTVDESTPLDQTVGIDPEMLGKVFENLLEAEARHASGTYYTPRSIVEYMCRETLYRHCHAHAGIDRDAFLHLFDCALEGRKPETEKALAQRLEAVLDNITVLDPAVGSGAFLLGMLQEILMLKESLARARGDAEERILAARAARKAAIIHGSLYAVDISFPAIEIARLRLWLALVVDQNEPHPLPNLDYHIIRGDTLKTLLDGKPVLPLDDAAKDDLFGESNQHVESLLRHKAALYSANGEEKARLRREIRSELSAMIEAHWAKSETTLRGNARDLLDAAPGADPERLPKPKLKRYLETQAMLEKIDEERQRLSESRDKGEELDLPFTPLHLYFAEVFSGSEPGFDIVIANPPYVRHEEIKEIKPQLEAEFGNFYCGTADLYTYFYKRGLELLKTDGHLCFIAPNKFMRAGYGSNARKLLVHEATPKVVIDFGELPVFEAGTDPSIILVEKAQSSPDSQLTAAIIKNASDIERVSEAVDKRGFTMKVMDLRPEGWTLESPEVLALMEKLRKSGVPLDKYVKGRFYYGIKTGFNEAFVIDAATREKLITEDPKSAELIKPWLRGRDIRKWQAEWAGLYVIAIASSANREWPWSKAKSEADARPIFATSYPAIHTHLSSYEDKLRKRDDQGQFWWELRSCAYFAEFEQPKIVYPDIAKFFRASWDEAHSFLGNTCYFIPTEDKFLFGVLCSKLFDYYFRQNFQVLGDAFSGGRIRFFTQDMEQIPIFPATDAQKSPLVRRVEAILANPESPEVSKLEAEIDELVFDLYGLTAAERQLILAAGD